MGSKTVLLLLRAAPPSPSPLLSIGKCAFPISSVANKRFYGAKSILELSDVQRLAETARISLTSQQVEDFAPKIRQVVDWFGQLQAVDLQAVEPAIRADTEGDNLRADVPEIFDNRDAITEAVPNYEDSHIKVPKVLNKE